mmetsp:Transcript_23884/g.71656  ORF Transcript_23884/g.71656 Transcript_23884/m.71656 type:complete len:80 (-) Transcript_23884:6-245(-)
MGPLQPDQGGPGIPPARLLALRGRQILRIEPPPEDPVAVGWNPSAPLVVDAIALRTLSDATPDITAKFPRTMRVRRREG